MTETDIDQITQQIHQLELEKEKKLKLLEDNKKKNDQNNLDLLLQEINLKKEQIKISTGYRRYTVWSDIIKFLEPIYNLLINFDERLKILENNNKNLSSIIDNEFEEEE